MSSSRRFVDLQERARNDPALTVAVKFAVDNLKLSEHEAEYLWSLALAGAAVGIAYANERWSRDVRKFMDDGVSQR